MIGAGLGAGRGIEASTTTDLGTSKALTSTGFAAWGAWTGAFAGALASRDSHEVTLGGLFGANLGALLGYGLVKTDLVHPHDFGWLRLAGAVGTALGGGVRAALSSKDDPRPALAGLAAGPLLGIATGAVLVPRLRSASSSGESHAPWIPGRKAAGVSFKLGDSASGIQRPVKRASGRYDVLTIPILVVIVRGPWFDDCSRSASHLRFYLVLRPPYDRCASWIVHTRTIAANSTTGQTHPGRPSMRRCTGRGSAPSCMRWRAERW